MTVQFLVDHPPLENASFEVENLKNAIIGMHKFIIVGLHHEVDGFHTANLDLVDSIDARHQRVVPFLFDVRNHFRQDPLQ